MKARVVLSACMGALFSAAAFALLHCLQIDRPLLTAFLAGLLFFILLLAFLCFYSDALHKKYAAFEKEYIVSPIFYKAAGNFVLGNGKIKNGTVYFCEGGIVCVCLEEKPYALDEIPRQNITRFDYTPTRLTVYTNDGKMLVITLPNAPKIMELLHQKGWAEPY